MQFLHRSVICEGQSETCVLGEPLGYRRAACAWKRWSKVLKPWLCADWVSRRGLRLARRVFCSAPEVPHDAWLLVRPVRAPGVARCSRRLFLPASVRSAAASSPPRCGLLYFDTASCGATRMVAADVVLPRVDQRSSFFPIRFPAEGVDEVAGARVVGRWRYEEEHSEHFIFEPQCDGYPRAPLERGSHVCCETQLCLPESWMPH